MSILVSGGAGYIGSHACVELIEAGYDIVVVDNLSNSCEEAIRRVERITGKKIPFINTELCDEAATEAVFRQYPDIDSVMHFAGLKAVGESVAKPLEYYTNNLVSTLVLLNVMRKHGVKTSCSPPPPPFTATPPACPSARISPPAALPIPTAPPSFSSSAYSWTTAPPTPV